MLPLFKEQRRLALRLNQLSRIQQARHVVSQRLRLTLTATTGNRQRTPDIGLLIILRDTNALLVEAGQIVLRQGMTLFGCSREESRRLVEILWRATPFLEHQTKLVLSPCMPLIHGQAIPGSRLLVIQLDDTTRFIQHRQIVLRIRVPQISGLPEQLQSTGIIDVTTESMQTHLGQLGATLRITLGGRLAEPAIRLLVILLHPQPLPVHHPQAVLRLGKSFGGDAAIEGEGLQIILQHTLSQLIEPPQCQIGLLVALFG